MLFTKSVLFFLLIFFSIQVYSQENLNPKNQLLLVSGYSPISVRLLGKTPNSLSSIIKFEFRRITKLLFLGEPLYYQFGVIPYIQFEYPKRDNGDRKDLVNGFGLSPFGLGIHKHVFKKFNYTLYSYGGIILIDKRFPTDKGRRLNYTFSLSADAVYRLTNLFSLSLGYKFHHISNAQTGKENPGLDSNFITISLIISK